MRALGRVVLITVVSVFMGGFSQVSRAQAPLTSVAIDPTLYRDGAITRFSGAFGAWTYVCDEVTKLKQRFCSLRSVIKSAMGIPVANLTVSTGQDGRPAGLLVMAAQQVTRFGVEVLATAPLVSSAATDAKSKPRPAMRVYPASCAADICQLVWSLPPVQIDALNTGGGLILRYVPPSQGASEPAPAGRVVDIPIAADGFAAAVQASLQPRE